MKNKTKESEQLFGDISDKLSTAKTEVEITPELQAEYITYHDKINSDRYEEDDTIKKSRKLFKEDIDDKNKKEILFILAHIGTLPCVRIIEKYLDKASGEMKAWAVLAFEEAWMFLENEAMGTNQSKILSGSGGDGERLRYYFSAFSSGKRLPDDNQKEKLKNSFEEVSKKFGSEIETVEFNGYFLLVSVLISMDVSVGDFIENIIKFCNKNGEVLNSKYFVTNIWKAALGRNQGTL